MSALGTVIRDAREAAGLTRAQLAARGAVSHVFLGKIEGGTRRPSAAKLKSIATALQLEPSELLGRAALLDVASPNEDDVRRRLMRVAAMRSGVAAAVPVLGLAAGGPIGAIVGAALGQTLAAQVGRAAANRQDPGGPHPGTDPARQELLALVEAMDADDCTTALAVLRHAMLAAPRAPKASETI